MNEEDRAREVYDAALLTEHLATGKDTPGFARRSAIRAMLAFATPAPVIETEGSACDVCGGTGRNNSDQLWPGHFPCRYCSGSGKEDAAERFIDREAGSGGERRPFAIGTVVRAGKVYFHREGELVVVVDHHRKVSSEPDWIVLHGKPGHYSPNGFTKASTEEIAEALALRPVGAENVRERALEKAARHALTFIENRFSDLSPEKRSTVEHLRRALTPATRNGEDGHDDSSPQS